MDQTDRPDSSDSKHGNNTPGPTFAFPQFDSKNLDHGDLLVAPVSRNARCGASTESISKSAPPLPFLCLKLLAVKYLSLLGDPLHKIDSLVSEIKPEPNIFLLKATLYKT